MLTDADIAECRKTLLRQGMFSEENVDTIVELARQITVQTNRDPTGSQLLDATVLIISLSNAGCSDDKIKVEVEKAVNNVCRVV